MKQGFSKSWKESKQPRKQRKYMYNAPVNVARKFLASHLSKELRTKYGRRSVTLRKGDKVKILRGSSKGQVGKIDRIDKGKLVGLYSMKKELIGLAEAKLTSKDIMEKNHGLCAQPIAIIMDRNLYPKNWIK